MRFVTVICFYLLESRCSLWTGSLPAGISSMMLTSRSPKIVNCNERGIGVAVGSVATLALASTSNHPMVGAALGLDGERLEGLRIAGLVHDVGKVEIPSEILSKPGRLSPLEFELIKTHAGSSYDILREIDFPWPVAEIARQHHEKLDGSGYPRGLKGDEILLEARILTVADVVEAMASHRPYRPSLGLEAALGEIERNSGILYDPVVVRACAAVLENSPGILGAS